MYTAGVDMAAQTKNTWVAVIAWSAGKATIDRLFGAASDAQIIEVAKEVKKIGIDCPFGWPDPFIDFIIAHRHNITDRTVALSEHWRRNLTNRSTDLIVWREAGKPPLSVSADKIGHVAMRCATLLAEMTNCGLTVDRSGVTGIAAEVYPAASLKSWGLSYERYKRKENRLSLNALVDELKLAAPWIEFGAFEDTCRNTDDAFDAIIAALTARAILKGLASKPGEGLLEVASREGWICLPIRGSLPKLIDP